MRDLKDDPELQKRLAVYDQWLREGKIPCSSKVIPVGRSLGGLQWVLPTQQAGEILRNARSFALAHCLCRSQHQRCDHPREVCFYLNDVADQKVAQGQARRVSLEEANQTLLLANQHGLVHLTIYNPEQHVFALCSCCQCCCHDMAFMKAFGRPDLVAHADYLAVVDKERCTHCGICVERCGFGAQVWEGGQTVFDAARCYGCGLCVDTCPSQAIGMALRQAQGRGLAPGLSSA